jgi:hypothetical protein
MKIEDIAPERIMHLTAEQRDTLAHALAILANADRLDKECKELFAQIKKNQEKRGR